MSPHFGGNYKFRLRPLDSDVLQILLQVQSMLDLGSPLLHHGPCYRAWGRGLGSTDLVWLRGYHPGTEILRPESRMFSRLPRRFGITTTRSYGNAF